jgi:hypothetical protein
MFLSIDISQSYESPATTFDAIRSWVKASAKPARTYSSKLAAVPSLVIYSLVAPTASAAFVPTVLAK